MMSKIGHDIKKFLMTLKHVMTPKSSSWRQKRVMTPKSSSWRQKYVMTSNARTRHDIKKHHYVKNTWKVRHDLWPIPWIFLDTNRPTVNKVWYSPVDTHIRTKTHTDTHTNASIILTSLYWWISSSVLTNSCLNGEIWSYTVMKISCSKLWSVCIVLCFVVFTNTKPLLHSI